MDKLCECGCGKPVGVYKFGKNKGLPTRFLKGHATLVMTMEEVIARFWLNVDKNGPIPKHRPELGACWLYARTRTNTKSGDKRGVVWIGTEKRNQEAHVFSYCLHFGSVPPDHFVCHHCDQGDCVRPSHLFAGTPGHNSRDMVKKGRQARGERNGGGGKLRLEDAQEIRRLYATGQISQTELASRFKVQKTTVNRIVMGKIWREIQDGLQPVLDSIKRRLVPSVNKAYRKSKLGRRNPMFGKKPWNYGIKSAAVLLLLSFFPLLSFSQSIIPVYSEARIKHHLKGTWTVLNLGVTPMPVTIEPKELVQGANGQPGFQPLSPDVHVELKETSAVIPPKGQRAFEYKISCERNCAVSFFNAMMGKTKEEISVRLIIPSTVWACVDSAKDCRMRSKKALNITQ